MGNKIKLGIVFVMMIIVIISVVYLSFFYNNVNEIDDVKCARNSRFNVDYPFCSDLLKCMKDCKLIGGEYNSMRLRGISGDICFCSFNRGIENIW